MTTIKERERKRLCTGLFMQWKSPLGWSYTLWLDGISLMFESLTVTSVNLPTQNVDVSDCCAAKLCKCERKLLPSFIEVPGLDRACWAKMHPRHRDVGSHCVCWIHRKHIWKGVVCSSNFPGVTDKLSKRNYSYWYFWFQMHLRKCWICPTVLHQLHPLTEICQRKGNMKNFYIVLILC